MVSPRIGETDFEIQMGIEDMSLKRSKSIQSILTERIGEMFEYIAWNHASALPFYLECG
jgi:hypothetical protein